MKVSPRNPNEPILTRNMLVGILLQSLGLEEQLCLLIDGGFLPMQII